MRKDNTPQGSNGNDICTYKIKLRDEALGNARNVLLTIASDFKYAQTSSFLNILLNFKDEFGQKEKYPSFSWFMFDINKNFKETKDWNKFIDTINHYDDIMGKLFKPRLERDDIQAWQDNREPSTYPVEMSVAYLYSRLQELKENLNDKDSDGYKNNTQTVIFDDKEVTIFADDLLDFLPRLAYLDFVALVLYFCSDLDIVDFFDYTFGNDAQAQDEHYQIFKYSLAYMYCLNEVFMDRMSFFVNTGYVQEIFDVKPIATGVGLASELELAF